MEASVRLVIYHNDVQDSPGTSVRIVLITTSCLMWLLVTCFVLFVLGEMLSHLLGFRSGVPTLEGWIGPICHHMPERTLSLRGALPVCARCSGLYLGLILAVFIAAFLCPVSSSRESLMTRRVLVSCVILFVFSVLEAIGESLNVFHTSNHARLLVGVPLGLVPALVVCLGCKTIRSELADRRQSGTRQ